jgi:Na+/proline symporter
MYFFIIITYLLQGGLKAVIWTDVFQSVVMVAGLIVVLVVGSNEVGGLSKVWQINKDFGRMNFFE